MRYIKMIVREERQARVPQQLLSKDLETEKTNKDGNDGNKEESLDEYSGVGSIMGYVAPLGVSVDNRMSATKKKKKR